MFISVSLVFIQGTFLLIIQLNTPVGPVVSLIRSLAARKHQMLTKELIFHAESVFRFDYGLRIEALLFVAKV